MTYALKILRKELNKERSYAHHFYKRIGNGLDISPELQLEMRKRDKEKRVASMEIAILALKKYKRKPQYYWTGPESQREIV